MHKPEKESVEITKHLQRVVEHLKVSLLDEAGFLSYMKERRNPPDKIKSYTNRIRRFEKYLTEHELGKSIKDVATADLKKYVEWCEASNTNPYQELFGIQEYYWFLGNETLSYSCNQVMQMI